MSTTSEIPSQGTARLPQARSAATRRRLLRATLTCLVERGYANTTTSEIAREAGVSQGAVFKHFPTKLALYAAATEDLFIELVADYRRDFDAAEKGEDPVGFAVSLLWQTFCSPELQAAFELYMACRTDPALREKVAPVLARHRENLRQEARRLFPDHAHLPRFAPALDTLMDAMQGRVLGSAVLAEPDSERAEMAYLTELMRRELLAAAA